GEEILGLPVRRGLPKGVGGLVEAVRSPTFSTAVGLVHYGFGRVSLGASGDQAKRGGLFTRMRRTLSNVF
ncbi:MAG: cell division protein FtsA, partial [Polyangia bacterium]